MSRREINIFGTSFLDLLSGALAAVIILFVIVPKKTQDDIDLMKDVQELNAVANDVKDAIEKIKSSIPKDVFEKIKKEIDQANRKIAEMQQRINDIEQKAKELTAENASLKSRVQQQQSEIDKLKKQVEELTAQLKAEQEKNEQASSTTTALEKTLGVFAKFGIICKWEEMDADVDMGVFKFEEVKGNSFCWWNYPSQPWGVMGEDLRQRSRQDEKECFELFYSTNIHYGEYTLYSDIYTKSKASQATVSYILLYHPGKPDEKKIIKGPMKIGKATKLIISFRLTEDGLEELNELKNPKWGEGPDPEK